MPISNSIDVINELSLTNILEHASLIFAIKITIKRSEEKMPSVPIIYTRVIILLYRFLPRNNLSSVFGAFGAYESLMPTHLTL